MIERSTMLRWACLVGSTVAVGCAPVGIFDDDASAWRPAPERTTQIRGVDLVEESLSPPEGPDVAVEFMLEDKVAIAVSTTARDLDVSAVRVAVLRNNLDLRAELYAPSIARAEFGAERAKFESTVFASYTRNDQGVLTNLEQGEPTNQDEFLAGVRVPLATGGEVTVDTLATQRDQGAEGLLADAEPWESNLRFSISQPLLRDAGINANTASIRIAAWNRDIVDARVKLAAIRILADADRDYWRLFAAVRELEVRRTQYESALAQLERAERRFRAGDVAEIEVIRARSGVGSTIESIIRADAAVRRQQRVLKRVMNDPEAPLDGDLFLDPSTKPSPLRIELDPQTLVERAIANRMEMLEIELQIAIDALTVDLRRNQSLPLVAFDYRYSIQGDDRSFSTAYSALGDFDSHRIGVSGEIPIGNEVRESRLNAAVLERAQRLATRNARRLAIEAEVLDALDRLQEAWQTILAARLETVLAGRTVDAEKRQFDVGLRTSTDVLDAESRLADAQSREVRALADYEIALVDIAFATGTVLGSVGVDIVEEDGEARLDVVESSD